MDAEKSLYPDFLKDSRFQLPDEIISRFKDQNLVMTISVIHENFKTTDPYIICYTENDWTVLEENISKMKRNSLSFRYFISLLGYAIYVACPEVGRLSIPQPLIDKANITDEVLVIGYPNRFELWNPDSYNKIVD